MGWWDSTVDSVTDFVSGGGGSGVTDSWMTEAQNAAYNGAGATSDWDIGDIFSPVGSALGTAWDWGTKNPAALGGIVGAGTAVANYMFQPDTAAETQSEYLEKRRKEHNKGISKAAEKYRR